MANTTRTSTPNNPNAAGRRSRNNLNSASRSTGGGASDAGSFIDAVKKSPIASAVIAAGVAGAGAFIWANRSQIADQAGALGEKASDLGGKISERASAVGEMLSEQASALGGKVGETYATATGATAKSQQEYAEEALSLRESGDPMLTEQSKIGSVGY